WTDRIGCPLGDSPCTALRESCRRRRVRIPGGLRSGIPHRRPCDGRTIGDYAYAAVDGDLIMTAGEVQPVAGRCGRPASTSSPCTTWTRGSEAVSKCHLATFPKTELGSHQPMQESPKFLRHDAGNFPEKSRSRECSGPVTVSDTLAIDPVEYTSYV